MSHWNTTTALCEICNELTMLDEISDGICTHCRDNYEAHRMDDGNMPHDVGCYCECPECVGGRDD